MITNLEMLSVTGSNKHGKRRAIFKCACGKHFETEIASVNSGNTKSCGCLKLNRMTKHGKYQTRTYRIWQAMLNRCRQEQYKKYYGHLSVCFEWKDFERFLSDMGECPDGLSIDRIDNSKGYSKENCRWATQKTQVRNTRRRKEYEFRGEKKSLIEWAESVGMSHEKLRGRIRRGWEIKDAITTV